jgi:hypothetical protein
MTIARRIVAASFHPLEAQRQRSLAAGRLMRA